jgi:hypothetical protein
MAMFQPSVGKGVVPPNRIEKIRLVDYTACSIVRSQPIDGGATVIVKGYIAFVKWYYRSIEVHVGSSRLGGVVLIVALNGM